MFRGACLRVLTVVCEDMTPQSDLWRLWKRKLTRVATHSESPRLHSLQRRAPTAPKWWAWRSRPVPETNVPGDAAFAGTRNATYRIVHADNQR